MSANPFYDAHETSLSKLDDHDWHILSSRWHRGIDWTVGKVGKRWEITGRLGEGFPLFKTKTAAHDAASTLILMESRYRSRLAWDREQAA